MATRRLRAFLGSVGLLLAVGATAPTAQAAYEQQVDLQCKFPVVGIKPIAVTLSGTLPLRITDVAPKADVNLSSAALTAALRDLGAAKVSADLAPVIGLETPGATAETRWPRGELPAGQDVDLTTPLRGSFAMEPFFVQRATTTSLSLSDLKLNVRALGADGNPIFLPTLTSGVDGETVSSWDSDPATFVVACKPAPGASSRFAEIQGDEPCGVLAPCPAPPAPTDVRGSARRPTTGTAAWRPSYDPVVAGYIVELDGGSAEHRLGRTDSYQFSGLEPATTYRGTVRTYSRTTGAPDSQRIPFSFTTPIAGKPSVPVVTATSTDTTVTLNWAPSTSASPITFYTIDNIIISGTWAGEYLTEGSGTVPEFTWTGLTPSTQYKFRVTAHNASGEEATSAPVYVTTKVTSAPVYERFALRGTTTLPTLMRSVVPVNSGALGLTYTPSTGKVTGGFTLVPSSARVISGGYLPVTAKLGFTPVGSATGTYDGRNLTVSQLMRVKVLSLSAFGAIPLAIGNGCQAKSLATITLGSGESGFNFSSGGTLRGTYSISDLNGCATAAGFINPAVAGANNSITLEATVDDGPIPD